MNKTAWTVVIIIVVLILLYILYKYTFKKKSDSVNAVLNQYQFNPNIPKVLPIDSVAININTPTDNSSKLDRMINCLGYQTQPINGDGVVSSYVTGKTINLFSKRFPKTEVVTANGSNIIPIVIDGITYKLDKDKFIEMQGLGLYNSINYNIKNDSQITSLIDKLNNFWGVDYFNDCLGFSNPVAANTERAIKNAIENSKPIVDCNGNDYKEKLLRLSTNLKQAGQAYQIAVWNLNNVDNAENTQALSRTSKNLKNADEEYKKHLALCNK